MPGFNEKKLKRSTVVFYNADNEEVSKESYAEYVMIHEEYTDGTFREVWGYINDLEQ